VDSRRVRAPVNAGEARNEAEIELFELWALFLNYVSYFTPVLRGEVHSQVAFVTESGYALEEFRFGKGLGEGKEGSADGGG
jgi:hypothetical protein